jgi:hypothetical protein
VRGFKVCTLILAWFAFAGPAVAIVMNEREGFGISLDQLVASGHVGTVAGRRLTIVYLGEGWVLTASHVGAQDVEIEGRVYRKAPEPTVQIYNDDRTAADLIAYRILGNPDFPALPPLEISEQTPAKGAFAILAGAGREKSDENRSLAGALRRIWRGLADARPRWGTNTIAGASERVTIGDRVTDAIITEYSLVDDLFATPYEAQAVTGDSGGALFVAEGDAFVLAGVLFAASSGDPYGSEPSRTFAVDLARYREQILAAIEAEATDRRLERSSDDAPKSESNVENWIVGSITAAVVLGVGLSVGIRHARFGRRAQPANDER